jgi:hypothetical protein
MSKRNPSLNAKLANAMAQDPRTDRTKFQPVDPKTQSAIQRAQNEGRLGESWLDEN